MSNRVETASKNYTKLPKRNQYQQHKTKYSGVLSIKILFHVEKIIFKSQKRQINK